jgi:hypothetical protein
MIVLKIFYLKFLFISLLVCYFIVFLKVCSFIFGSHSPASSGSVRRHPRTNRDGNALFVISFAHKWVSFGGIRMIHDFLAWLPK